MPTPRSLVWTVALLAAVLLAPPPAAAQEGASVGPGDFDALDARAGLDLAGPRPPTGPDAVPPPDVFGVPRSAPAPEPPPAVPPVREVGSVEYMRTAHPAVFLERSYISFPSFPYSFGTSDLGPMDRNLFEGAGSLHLFAYNGLVRPEILNEGGRTWTVSASFLPVVRMLTENSDPVRTPTYRIRFPYVQRIWVARPASRDSADLVRIGLSDVEGGFTHYSNGQEGCFYRGFSRGLSDGDDVCRVIGNPALAADSIVNVRTGDFSTSYLSLAYNRRWGRLFSPTYPVHWQFSVGAEGQFHLFDDVAIGGMSREQARAYGLHQVVLRGEGERRFGWNGGVRRTDGTVDMRWYAGVARLTATLMGRGPYPVRLDVKAAAVTLEGAYIFDRALGFGVFARGHVGPDPYNIRFVDEGPIVHAGITWDTGRLDFFGRGAAVPSPDEPGR